MIFGGLSALDYICTTKIDFINSPNTIVFIWLSLQFFTLAALLSVENPFFNFIFFRCINFQSVQCHFKFIQMEMENGRRNKKVKKNHQRCEKRLNETRFSTFHDSHDTENAIEIVEGKHKTLRRTHTYIRTNRARERERPYCASTIRVEIHIANAASVLVA